MRGSAMNRFVKLAGMSAGGWLGWQLGTPFSTFTAFVVSVLGTGFGLYLTNRFIEQHLP